MYSEINYVDVLLFREDLSFCILLYIDEHTSLYTDKVYKFQMISSNSLWISQIKLYPFHFHYHCFYGFGFDFLCFSFFPSFFPLHEIFLQSKNLPEAFTNQLP